MFKRKKRHKVLHSIYNKCKEINKQNLALANCTYINIFFYTITFNFLHIKLFTILLITSRFSLYLLFFKKCLSDLQLVL